MLRPSWFLVLLLQPVRKVQENQEEQHQNSLIQLLLVVPGEVRPAQGQSPRAQNSENGVQWGAVGPGGNRPREQTQKQDGVIGPKLKNKMASFRPSRRLWVYIVMVYR